MVPSPEYGTTLARDMGMAARDGVHLATDVWRPARHGEALPGPFPAVMVRTPYDRTDPRHGPEAEFWTSRGFVFVVQDCRGRFASDGDFVLFANEGPDGYDAVEWVAALAFCDGNVGTYGTSYPGWVQNALAIEQPPHLRAMWINQGGSNGNRTALRHNGAMELRWLAWAVAHGATTSMESDPELAQALWEHGLSMYEWLRRLPWREESPLSELPGYDRWARELYERGDEVSEDRFWHQSGLNFAAHYDRTADVPTIYSGGWYDSYARATTDNFVALGGRLRHQKLLMGPWTHGSVTLEQPTAGEVDLGPAAAMNSNDEVFPGGSWLGELFRWFDFWLRGNDDGVADTADVRIFVMGGGTGRRTEEGLLDHGGRWRDEAAWPLERAVVAPFYFQPDGGLDRFPPPEDGGSSSFPYDPRHPMPTVSANTSSLTDFVPVPQRVDPLRAISLMRPMVIHGAADQRVRADTLRTDDFTGPLELRDDVIVFETEPLDDDIEVTGPIAATIYLSSDVADTDLFVMVQDVYPSSADWPDGFRLNVADGLMRVRYREGFDRGRLLTPGEVVTVEFQLYPTSNLFVAGHRMRVLVSSSSFPRFDVNPNTGEPLGRHTRTRLATNRIHHSASHPSSINVPLVPLSAR
ncbi:MAG: CocE/NonD family hydrolase [bacterium]|nr:CocE/NonD family hydrolase [bacterium]MDE0290545.1 CocE/NonD family hydrolase [bacterium]MDE0436940.1 CocE/NonD family hydrolase [bacterium]